MVEDGTREEKLFEKSKGDKPSPKKGAPLKEKFVQAVTSARSLLSKPGAKGGKPSGGPNVVPGTVKPAGGVPPVFSSHGLDLKSFNQVLILILITLVAVTIYVVSRPQPDISAVTAAVSRINFQDVQAEAIEVFQGASVYLEQIKTRDIFNRFKEKKAPVQIIEPAEPVEPPPPPPKVTIQEKAVNLKLMGISWGSNPKAIIRDASTENIFFLRAGEQIKGTDIEVKEILRKEIIISSDGEEMTML